MDSYNEKIYRQMLRDLTNNEFQIKKLAKYMINHQENYQIEMFNIWIKYYQMPNNSCDEMLKYLYLMFEITSKNIQFENWFYIKPVGDILEQLIKDFLYRARKEEDFDFFSNLLNKWHELGVYEALFLEEMKKLVKKKKLQFIEKVFNLNSVEEEAKIKFNEKKKDKVLCKQALIEMNTNIIKENYSYVKRLRDLIDGGHSKLQKENVKNYIKDKLINFRSMLIEDIALTQSLAEDIFEELNKEPNNLN